MNKKMKKFMPVFIVLIVYGVLALISLDTFNRASGEAIYYIREMVEIMPVIFGMVILIEVWLPRKVIEKHMGNKSGVTGIILAFLMGMLSAGPIYAAFPITKTLYKKGASTRNIVIILSSWAVIKVPMLVNEAKFLGVKFMVIRWVLTIMAILVIGVLMDKVVNKDEVIEKTVKPVNIKV